MSCSTRGCCIVVSFVSFNAPQLVHLSPVRIFVGSQPLQILHLVLAVSGPANRTTEAQRASVREPQRDSAQNFAYFVLAVRPKLNVLHSGNHNVILLKALRT
jgi:hypothetical protein